MAKKLEVIINGVTYVPADEAVVAPPVGRELGGMPYEKVSKKKKKVVKGGKPVLPAGFGSY